MEFKHKTILVLGAGVSGIAVAGILQKHGGRVILNDAKSASKIQQDFTFLERCGVQLIFGRQDESLLADIDYLIVSPGISIHLPLVQTAKALGITVMSEIEVAYRLCRAPIVAITGTNGKTTTTTLIGDMLRTTGRDIVVGGNIGAALSKEVENIGANGLVVAEISSFQLEGIINFRPQIAAVLNITPDHLDRHHSIDLYQQTKEHIFKNQTPADYLVLNYDDEKIRPMAERAAAKVMYFSRKEQLPQGVFVQQGSFTIAWDDQTYVICPVADLKIKGAHNVENVLAACGAAFLAGVEPARLAAVIKTFQRDRKSTL